MQIRRLLHDYQKACFGMAAVILQSNKVGVDKNRHIHTQAQRHEVMLCR